MGFDAQQHTTNPEWRLQREWMRDGLPDIFCGVFILLIFGVGAGVSWAAARHAWLFLLFPVLIGGGSLALMSAFFRLKARVADPRVGFVRPRLPFVLRSPRHVRGFLIACGVVGSAVAFVGPPVRDRLYHHVPAVETWWPLLWLVPGFVALAATGQRYEGTGHLRVAAVAVLATVLALRLGLSVRESVEWVTWPVIGVGLIAIGAVALRSFLRAHPLPPSVP